MSSGPTIWFRIVSPGHWRKSICGRREAIFGPGYSQGTVNLSVPLSRMHTNGSGYGDLLATRAADFRPDLECLGPGSSMLGGSDMIPAEVEQVIDLIVG